MIISGPLVAKRRRDTVHWLPVHSTDITPTLLQLAGINAPLPVAPGFAGLPAELSPLDGVSFVDALFAEQADIDVATAGPGPNEN